jgi:hypothetical protein
MAGSQEQSAEHTRACGRVMGTRHGIALQAFANHECPWAKDSFEHLRRWIACNPAYFVEPRAQAGFV